ncbi:MAG TPA: hypothetical protein VNJ05_07750 [Sphingomicrobium sp.]|nr:hypothetical protein [Sphingomicrobium sp.]
MTDTPRQPHADNDVIDEADELPTPSQGGTSGGRIEREIGAADEEKVATGADPQPTSVHKSQKPHGGDEPTLPNREQTRSSQDKARPRRTR